MQEIHWISLYMDGRGGLCPGGFITKMLLFWHVDGLICGGLVTGGL